MNVQTITIDPVDRLLNTGLKNLWYAVCPSDFVKTEPVSLRRFGRKIALWRDAAGRCMRWKTTARTAARRCPRA
jgi:hypothetical protein